MRFNRSIHISALFMLFGVVAAVQTHHVVEYL